MTQPTAQVDRTGGATNVTRTICACAAKCGVEAYPLNPRQCGVCDGKLALHCGVSMGQGVILCGSDKCQGEFDALKVAVGLGTALGRAVDVPAALSSALAAAAGSWMQSQEGKNMVTTINAKKKQFVPGANVKALCRLYPKHATFEGIVLKEVSPALFLIAYQDKSATGKYSRDIETVPVTDIEFVSAAVTATTDVVAQMIAQYELSGHWARIVGLSGQPVGQDLVGYVTSFAKDGTAVLSKMDNGSTTEVALQWYQKQSNVRVMHANLVTCDAPDTKRPAVGPAGGAGAGTAAAKKGRR